MTRCGDKPERSGPRTEYGSSLWSARKNGTLPCESGIVSVGVAAAVRGVAPETRGRALPARIRTRITTGRWHWVYGLAVK